MANKLNPIDKIPVVCEESPTGKHCWHDEGGYWTTNGQRQVCCWCGVKYQVHGSHVPTPSMPNVRFTGDSDHER